MLTLPTTREGWDWMVFKGPFQALNILWLHVSCLGSVCLKCLNSRQYQQARAVLLCLVPQGTAAPEVLFQPQVIFHRLERWKTTSSTRQQFPVFSLLDNCSSQTCPWWLGQQQEAGFNAEVGSAGDLFTIGCSWGLFPGDTAAGMEQVRGLPQGTTLKCFFSLV